VHLRKPRFSPPPGRAGQVRREAILERLLGTLDVPRVVLLQGPAGHGKSTTLQQLARCSSERGARVGWLTLGDSDNDARRFFGHLQGLLAALAVDAARTADDASAESPDPGGCDWLVDALAAVEQPLVLVFDDFQALDNPGLLSFFRHLLSELPANVRVFIGSRNTPDVGFSRLVVNGLAIALHAAELRFSRAEVARFFASAAEVEVSGDELESIYLRSEGWPAALQLFRLTLASPQVRSSLGSPGSYTPRELSEYLAENVLGLQPPAIQDFLLRTSVLTRLCAPLCESVTGRSDAHEILLQLERSGLFLTSLEPESHWFQYHALFSSFLAEQLRTRSPELFLDVHRRAAQWHRQKGEPGEPEELVRHAIASGDMTLAADTFNRWASSLVALGQIVTVERWYDRLPFDEIARRPDLAIKAGYALAFLRRRAKLPPLLDRLAKLEGGDLAATSDPKVLLSMAAICADDVAQAFALVERVDLHDDSVGGFAAFELAAASNLLGLKAIAMGDLEKARTHLARARAHNELGGATWSRGWTEGLFGVLHLSAGDLRPALSRFAAALAEERMHVDSSFAVAALASCYVWALYEADELDAAEAIFTRYRELIAQSTIVDFFAVAHIAMSRVHQARGQTARAVELLEEAEAIGDANGWARLLGLVGWERARRALAEGDVVRAKAIAPRALGPVAPWTPFSDDLEGEAFGRIRLCIRGGELLDAEARLKRELGRQPARVVRRIKLLLISAQLQRAKGSRTGTQRALRQALQLAAPGGFVRCFLDEGEALAALADELQPADGVGHVAASRAFVARIVGAAAAPAHSPVAAVAEAAAANEPLTDREREVLSLLAEGVSNRDIGGAIFISENTVKYHLKNIYSKLAVSGRVQAIEAARRMGVIA
jgi:LuxR family maltose regulon positive regulatory protein